MKTSGQKAKTLKLEIMWASPHSNVLIGDRVLPANFGIIFTLISPARLVKYQTTNIVISKDIEDITWQRVDINFIFDVQLAISRVAALTCEMSRWTREDKIHIHKRACNILFIT